jgi:hypothetical protein
MLVNLMIKNNNGKKYFKTNRFLPRPKCCKI